MSILYRISPAEAIDPALLYPEDVFLMRRFDEKIYEKLARRSRAELRRKNDT